VPSATTNIVLSAINSYESFKNIWIGDSGEFCHYWNSEEGLLDQATNSKMITVGNTSTMKAEKVGNLRSCVLRYNGRKFEFTLENFKFFLTF
jgi:hypothetical protein